MLEQYSKLTKFHRWAAWYGHERLQEDMGVAYSVIYRWLNGEMTPRGEHMQKLLELSEGKIERLDLHVARETLRKLKKEN